MLFDKLRLCLEHSVSLLWLAVIPLALWPSGPLTAFWIETRFAHIDSVRWRKHGEHVLSLFKPLPYLLSRCSPGIFAMESTANRFIRLMGSCFQALTSCFFPMALFLRIRFVFVGFVLWQQRAIFFSTSWYPLQSSCYRIGQSLLLSHCCVFCFDFGARLK